MSQQPTDRRTASQKLDDHEKAIGAMYQTMDNIARDLMMVKEAMKLLGNKMEAVIKAINSSTPLNDENLSKLMVENNIEDLKEKVDGLVSNGIIKAGEVITQASFVVVQELDVTGKVVNPRLQFSLSALNPEAQQKLIGAKVGDSAALTDSGSQFNVLEVYDIVPPSPPQSPDAAPAAPAEASPAPVALAPAPDASPAPEAAPAAPAIDASPVPAQDASPAPVADPSAAPAAPAADASPAPEAAPAPTAGN